MSYFENFNVDIFWDDSEYAKKEYISKPPTNEVINKIENDLGYKLPESYIWLMKKHNGGTPINNCFPTNTPTSWANDHIAITGIYGVGYEKSSSLGGNFGSRFWIEEWEYPDIGVAICDCPSAGHHMVFLDYRECGPNGEPSVVFIDQENDYKITFLANNFESFIKGLINEEVYEQEFDDYEIESIEISEDLLKLLKDEE
ncbi:MULTISPECIES: SMI1/KNR4 family protein [Bacillaceae]|uniref:SMI1/KNR4 family protein n=1 Tax=Rossellomorea vietnamensis TaxID=218284 RepID=A0A6I6UNA0_9BACI|nr:MULTISPECIES: SMI1/KNR4 family protein [Rossellomorea]MBW3111221.1 SMI1/KNR4 family protein [Bacillus sp. MCCB 382]MDX8345229.1 SMI1/KNR4 family protein [Rossellomorea sp. YZS02]QHE62847.1 SMI1/KNR4 family protein [Rossellomorea vietnamensis]